LSISISYVSIRNSQTIQYTDNKKLINMLYNPSGILLFLNFRPLFFTYLKEVIYLLIHSAYFLGFTKGVSNSKGVLI
jgi:hypothetical protein